MEEIMRKAVCAALIKDNKILLVRKKEVWILPGGKPNENESDLECLCREIMKEELPGLTISNPVYICSFSGITPNKGDKLLAEVYSADFSGDITPSAEINKSEFAENPRDYNLSDITRKIVNFLYNKSYLL